LANLSAKEKRYLENAVFIAASRLIFTRLEECGTSLYKLSDVADTTSGGTPLRNVVIYFGGDIPWIKSGDLNDGLIEAVEEFITEEGLQNSSAKIFPAGTIVIALYGATVGKTGILTFDAATNQAVCAIFPKSSELKKEYLYWFLRHKRQDFLEMSFGGAQPNISQKLLRETLVPVPSSNIQTSVTLFLGAVEKRRLGDNVKLPDLPTPLTDLTYAVAHIETLAARIAEARGLRQQAVEEAEELCRAIIFTNPDHTSLAMSELLTQRELDVIVEPNETYQFAGVYSFGRGVFRSQQKTGAEFAYKRLTRLRAGEFVYPKLMAWEGALGIVPEECNGLVVSPEFPVFELNQELVLPETLDVYFRSPKVWPTLSNASTGTNIRRRRINPTDFLAYQFPLPSMKIQQKLRMVKARVDTLKRLQAETAAELDALLPAVSDRAFHLTP
jgi:hypothetical protein